ncbi:LytTR family DNA-binding domain-containing protein [Shimia gijangensis]|uniref:LytTR family DNA-binding domain-containing protein n=1 Tax=Shimia gijangensis TaxID=1470563 RepID=UPI0009344C79|nr:LytTR family DNA-binding domain-containing protein [Shimia gijangensis]
MNNNKLIILRKTYASLLSPICLTIWIVATVVAIVAGPFGTFSVLAFLERLAFWGLISSTSIVLGYAGVAVANMLWSDDRAITRNLVGAALAILVITTNVWAISQMPVWGPEERPGFGLLMSYITLITGAASLVKYLAQTALPWAVETPVAKNIAHASPRLMRRIPDAADKFVLHLSVQDHLVEVTTQEETHLIRMRFRDALDELDGVEGYRVHRSHWVASSAVD